MRSLFEAASRFGSHTTIDAARAMLLVLALAVTSAGVSSAKDSEDLPESLLAPTTVELIDSDQFQKVIEHHRGKAVLVNMWATWCIPCIQELPELNELQKRYEEKGLVVLAVSFDDPELLEERVRPFFKEKAPDLVSYLSSEDSFDFVEAWDPNWLGALPTSYFFDRDGELHKAVNGRLMFHDFEANALEVLATPNAE